MRIAKKLKVMSSVDFLGEGEIFCYSETQRLVGFRVKLHCQRIVCLGKTRSLEKVVEKKQF